METSKTIVNYLHDKGYKMKALGNVYRMRCPFPDHIEEIPSFTIYPSSNSFHCFGCKRGGTIMKLMKLFGDPIPPELIEEEKIRRTEHAKINIIQKDRLKKIQSIVMRIRKRRKFYRDQALLNRRVTRLAAIVKEFHI